MANFEIAVLFGAISTAFFLVYASSSIQGDREPGEGPNMFLQLMKLALFMMGFSMILFIAPMEVHIIELNNGSTPNYAPLIDVVSTQISITNIVFYFFMGLFLLYTLFIAVRWAWQSSRGKKNGGDE